MRVVIAGGHGQIALRLTKILAADGHEVVGLVRNPEHGADIARAGGQAAVLDLEKTDLDSVVDVLSGADVAIFSAGAGPGSGVERKKTVDKVDDRDPNDTFTVYLAAKKAAEDDLRSRDLDWTILRPGGLTNDPGTGKVLLEDKTGYGRISRDDVALVLAGLCSTAASIGRTLELIAGDTPVDEALANLAR